RQRRRLSGEREKRPLSLRFSNLARPISLVGSASSGSTGSPTRMTGLSSMRVSKASDLPRLEVDARIDQCIDKIGHQVNDEPEQRKNVERGKYDRIVAINHALEAQEPQAIERENRLDQQRTREESVDESAGEAGDDQQHGIAEHVAIEDLALSQPLRLCGQH